MQVIVKNTFLVFQEFESAQTDHSLGSKQRSRSVETHRNDSQRNPDLKSLNDVLCQFHTEVVPLTSSVTSSTSAQSKDKDALTISAKEDVGLRRILSVSTEMSQLEEGSPGQRTRLGSVASSMSFGSDFEGFDSRVVCDDGASGYTGQPPNHNPKAIVQDGVRKECTHKLVPKRVNLASQFLTTPLYGPPTTLMIRNIPNRYKNQDLLRELEHLKLGNSFDFFYLPMDTGTNCNVGYAFVNFVTPEYAKRCMTVMKDYIFKGQTKACKRAAITVAHIQGLEANMAHYRASAVNRMQKNRGNGPLVFAPNQESSRLVW